VKWSKLSLRFIWRQSFKPQNPDGHNNLGLAFLQTGDGQGAVAEFQAAIRLRSEDSGYIGNLGAAYLQIADFDSAMADFSKL